MTLREELIQLLWDAGIETPRLESDIILKHGAPKYPMYTKAEEEKVREILYRRIKHEPMDKILGQREFYKYTFKVNENVLSPRADTEILLESALNLINKENQTEILDLGTGTGCILLSLLKECPQASGTAVDVSAKAIEVAKENARNLNVEERVTFINKSWNEVNWNNKKYDIIVSNPPYIPQDEIKTLEIEVKEYDPMLALDGGKDGYDCYHEIAQIAPLIVKDGGYILLEVGYNQATIVNDIFVQQGFKSIDIAKDLSGINRCVILKKELQKKI